ncbi:MAG: hypothetical protein ACTJGR_02500 [Pauljensenia sp.]
MEPSSQDITHWDALARAGQAFGGTLRVFGDFFGKPLDNFHLPMSCEEGPSGELRFHFNEGELLSVWEPSDVQISGSEFHIGGARRVLWAWFYYGRPAAPENLRFIEHVVQGPLVSITRTGIRDRTTSRRWHLRNRDQPAVELVGHTQPAWPVRRVGRQRPVPLRSTTHEGGSRSPESSE